MKITKPFVTVATIVVIIGLCIGVAIAFLLTCEGDQCVLRARTPVPISSFEECVSAGHPVMESYPRQCTVPGGDTFAEEVSPESADEDSSVNVIVTAPQEGDVVGYAFPITGVARVFENVVNYRIKDEDESVLFEGYAMANSPDIGRFGPFLISVDVSAAKGKKGTLEVFQLSAKDGSEIDKVTVHVVFVK